MADLCLYSSLFLIPFFFSFRQFWTPCTNTNREFTSCEQTILTNILTVILRLLRLPRQLLLEWRLTRMKRSVLNLLLMIIFLAYVEYQKLILFLKWFCVREIWFSLRGSFKYLRFHSRELFGALLLIRYQFMRYLSTPGLFSLKQKKKIENTPRVTKKLVSRRIKRILKVRQISLQAGFTRYWSETSH